MATDALHQPHPLISRIHSTGIGKTISQSACGELWRYRDLLLFWVRRDISIRYRNTVLGVLWAFAQPLGYAAVFWICFSKQLSTRTTLGMPYPLVGFIGSMVWLYFSKAVLGASASLVLNSKLIRQVRFPRLVIPLATVIAGLLDFVLCLIFSFAIVAPFQTSWNLRDILVIPLLIFLTATLSYGFGTWLGTLHVRIRDVGYVLTFFMQLLLFLSPVIYPLSAVNSEYRPWVMLNPLTGIIEGFRSVLLGTPWNIDALLISAALTLFFAVGGTLYFRKYEGDFCDMA